MVPFLYLNASRHVWRRWPISKRSRECKTKIIKRKSAKIVQKLLGAVQFFNLERQYCQKIPRSGPVSPFLYYRSFLFNFHVQERHLLYLVLALQSKGLFCNFGHTFFQTTVSCLPLGALKYHHRVAATRKFILVRVSCLKRNFLFFQSD